MLTGLFQSTPSSQKVTVRKGTTCGYQKISIHTFLTEGDFTSFIIKLR